MAPHPGYSSQLLDMVAMKKETSKTKKLTAKKMNTGWSVDRENEDLFHVSHLFDV